MHPIYKLIEEQSVTIDAFNELISETNAKSVRERVRRLSNPIDANRMHDSQGHSRISPPVMGSRVADHKSGGPKNDPRKTARGKAMLKRQELTKSKAPKMEMGAFSAAVKETTKAPK